MNVTFLLVENSELVRWHLADLLREQLPPPVEILEAATAREALSLLRERRPDAALLDLKLAGGSGLEVLNTMRTEGLTTPVLVLSNDSRPGTREHCLKAGAKAFFDKSLEFDQAVVAVGQLARTRIPE